MSEKRGLGEHFEKRGLRSFRRINTYRVDRNLVLYQARGGAHRRQLVRALPFRNKLDGGKPSWIWGQKMRNRPQCRVTTPWGQNSDRKMTAVRDPGVAGGDLSEIKLYFCRSYRPLSKCFT
jgi:hypothetical protein